MKITKGKWELDPFFCTVDFSAKHLAITSVKGCFHKFNANIIADPTDMTTAEIDFTIQVDSVDTRIKDRDAHLLSSDFFDAENYPTIEFKSKEIIKTDENIYDLIGEVTFHVVTKLETFKLNYTGHQIDPMGNFEKNRLQRIENIKAQ
ncbi:YceI family protein [Ureibacillus sp. NPDC094379]